MTKTTFIILTIVLSTFQTKACDCKPLKSIQESYSQTTYILEVNVIRAKLGHQLDQGQPYLDSLSERNQKLHLWPVSANEYLLAVKQVFKGRTVADTIVLRTALDPVTDCGLLFIEGMTYILYAEEVTAGSRYFDRDNKRLVLTSSACTRTAEYLRKEENKLKKAAANKELS